MKILETQPAALPNPEVLAHLASLRTKKQQSPAMSTQLAAGIQNVETMLKEPASANDSPMSIRTLILALKPYALKKAELLIILNQQPRDLGLLDCVVEECDLRFSEEEQQRILGVLEEVLRPWRGNGNDGEGDDDING